MLRDLPPRSPARHNQEVTLTKAFAPLLEQQLKRSEAFSTIIDEVREMCFRLPAVMWVGAVRDSFLGNAPANDVDVVVDCSPEELKNLVKHFRKHATKNNFGGYKLPKRHLFDLTVDIWPLSETWAIKKRHILPMLPPEYAMSDLLQSGFFNIEQCIVAIHDFERGEATQSFFNCFGTTRTLDIVLEDNPFPIYQVLRAAVYCYELSLVPSPRLMKFIRRTASERGAKLTPWKLDPITHLMNIQKQSFANRQRVTTRVLRGFLAGCGATL